jgi:DNA-binding NarL/FixJ family response regulator
VPHTRILLLAGLEKIKGVLQAPELGVDGVVLRTQPPEVILAAVTVLVHPSTNAGAAAVNGRGLPRPYVAVWPASLSRQRPGQDASSLVCLPTNVDQHPGRRRTFST